MRFFSLLLAPCVLVCCSPSKEQESPPEPAVAAVQVVEEQTRAEKQSAAPGAALTAEWVAVVGDGAASDSARFAAVEQLLRVDHNLLAVLYRGRGNVPLLRRFIERKIAAEDAAVLPLLLTLFAQVGSEERIDFSRYILAFGRRAEADLYPLLYANNRSVALRAMDTLAKMRSASAADTIAQFLHHESNWMRMSAAHAIGEIGADGAVDVLVQTLGDSSYAVVNAALVGLGRLKAVAAYAQIEALLEDDNKHVRKHAAMALGELGDRRALEKVRALAANDEDAGVRFMAEKALEKLEQTR